MNTPWYLKYDQYKSELDQKVEALEIRCRELGIESRVVFAEHRNDLIARIARESNWNEGIYLDYGQTKILTDIAISGISIKGPHLDFQGIEREHRYMVANLKRQGKPLQEVANYNLSLATYLIGWVGTELANKQTTSLIVALKKLKPYLPMLPDSSPFKTIDRGFEVLEALERDQTDYSLPLDTGRLTMGNLIQEYQKLEFLDLLNPFKVDYIHFLHNIVMTGILPASKRGKFRRIHVHVGTDMIVFPPHLRYRPS